MNSIEHSSRDRRGAMAVSFLMTLLASILLLASPASAHRIDESYIYMDIYDTEIEGRLEFRVVDINAELGLDIPDDVDRAQTVVADTIGDIRSYAEPRFGLGTNGDAWTIEFTDEFELLDTENGVFVVIPFEVAETFDSVPDTVEAPRSTSPASTMVRKTRISRRSRSETFESIG